MTIFRIFIIIVFFNKTKEELFMVNDPITKIMRDASEIVRYDEVGIPLSIREGLLSAYPNHRALCHWHEDIEWVYIRSGQMNYYMNG